MFNTIFDKKMPPQKFVPKGLKQSSTMLTIDQVFYYFDYNQIKREDKRETKMVASRKDKYLFAQRFITDKMLRVAFYMSKMTVKDEAKEGDFEYNHLAFVEYLEFIARLAYYFFEETPQHFEWTLKEKLNVVLGWIFVPIDKKVVIPEERDQFQSESDDDY